jgi:hypothetical protein
MGEYTYTFFARHYNSTNDYIIITKSLYIVWLTCTRQSEITLLGRYSRKQLAARWYRQDNAFRSSEVMRSDERCFFRPSPPPSRRYNIYYIILLPCSAISSRRYSNSFNSRGRGRENKKFLLRRFSVIYCLLFLSTYSSSSTSSLHSFTVSPRFAYVGRGKYSRWHFPLPNPHPLPALAPTRWPFW